MLSVMTNVQGIDAVSGNHVQVEMHGAIQQVTDIITQPEDRHLFLAPGFIDLQVNGFGGVDYNDPATTAQQLEESIKAQLACGVTRIFPTVITGSQDRLRQCLKNMTKARGEFPLGEAMEGFHVEGPHISPEDGPRGAHPLEHVRPPNTAEFDDLQAAADGLVKLVTISAEYAESPKFTEHCVRQGVVVSIGHTKATADEIRACVDAGATMSTHMGNGAHQQMLRHPNYLWDQLAEDRLIASFIVDGIHVGENFLKCAIRAKGVERSVLVTDAVMPAGCPAGPYRIGGIDVILHPEGKVTLASSNRLAGAALKMDDAVGNIQAMIGLSLSDAVTMASRNAARAGRIRARQRGLQPGERGDVVKFSQDPRTRKITVLETYLSGQRVFAA
jgi:N-acetylglucosamine-6-phosphate deacetylase